LKNDKNHHKKSSKYNQIKPITLTNFSMKFDVKESAKYRAGVYIIRNTIDSRFYVGSSVNLYRRYQKHSKDLSKGCHHSIKMQRFVNRHGQNKLNFSVLEFCNPSETLKIEQRYLDKLQPFDSRGFNTVRNARIARYTLFGRLWTFTKRTVVVAGLAYLGLVYHQDIYKAIPEETIKTIQNKSFDLYEQLYSKGVEMMSHLIAR
jgi:predicted GIY-YIG superfamily endonuclease